MKNEIEKIKEIIVKEYKPEKIILFGSYARGDAKPDSDIDILVLSDHESNILKPKRGLHVRRKLGVIHTPLDILFFTNSEFAKYKNIKQSFNATVMREGICIYG